MNVGLWILVIVGGLTGAASTLYLTLSIPVVLVYKIYRKVRFRISLFD